MELGVCYYPEHWPDKAWESDARRMKEIGLSWVRIGEFAWSRLEPNSGELHFNWLERAIDTLGDAGLKVILCTPTPTPPKWLVDKYNDILQVDAEGRTRGFGSRRHYCFNSSSYRSETERIVALLAQRFGKHEAVEAWQTDNEYGCHGTVRCYCENCRQAFRDWLRERYADINALNEAWWNVFWSMEYRSFQEIELPNLAVTEPNPSHRLDYCRFSSDSVVTYNKLQVVILRQHSPNRPITHNTMGFSDDYDHFRLAEDLDVLTWDNYPLGLLERSPLPEPIKNHFMRSGEPDMISFHHDLYRGVKRKPFWVMEQQPGQVNWAPSNPLPAPGAVRLWSHQAFAHGADVVSYFRWRAARGAQELMHAGLNLHDGRPDRASEEASTVRSELTQGGMVEAEIALLFDYENLWATHLQRHAEGWDYWYLQRAYYSILRRWGLNVDVLHPRSDLSVYKVVLAPALHLVDEALAAHLGAYVREGGELVVGPRSGVKTLSNTVHASAPGPLSEFMGVHTERVDALRPGVKGTVELSSGVYHYSTWADLFLPTTAEVLGYYRTDAYDGTPAVVCQSYGAGRCTSMGMWGDSDLHCAIFRPILQRVGIKLLDLPKGLRLSCRGTRQTLLNFNPEPLPLGGELARFGEIIRPYGVLFFEENS